MGKIYFTCLLSLVAMTVFAQANFSKIGDCGDALAAMGQLEDALGALMQAKNMAAQWFKEHPNTPFSKHALANIYLKLGNLETALGDIDKAVIFYKSANRFSQELIDLYPTNRAFKNTLAA